MSVEKLVGPLHYAKIVQEFRSHINVKSVDASKFSHLRITDVEYSAFATKYFFELAYETMVEDPVTKSFLDTGYVKPKPPRLEEYLYRGWLREYVELDDPEKNKFEVVFSRIDPDASNIQEPILIDA